MYPSQSSPRFHSCRRSTARPRTDSGRLHRTLSRATRPISTTARNAAARGAWPNLSILVPLGSSAVRRHCPAGARRGPPRRRSQALGGIALAQPIRASVGAGVAVRSCLARYPCSSGLSSVRFHFRPPFFRTVTTRALFLITTTLFCALQS